MKSAYVFKQNAVQWWLATCEIELFHFL